MMKKERSTVLLLLFSIFFIQCSQNGGNVSRTIQKSANYKVSGIDISHHNTIQNWAKIKEDGIDFVYIKATEGVSHTDLNFQKHYESAAKSGLKVGAYHFYLFGVSGNQQANNFISEVRHCKLDLIPAIDVEINQQNPISKDSVYINNIITELSILEQRLFSLYGVRPIIYTNLECYELYIKDHFEDNLLWIVDLESEPSDTLKQWRIWQYSHRGEVQGIKGFVDLNHYRYDLNHFNELLLPY